MVGSWFATLGGSWRGWSGGGCFLSARPFGAGARLLDRKAAKGAALVAFLPVIGDVPPTWLHGVLSLHPVGQCDVTGKVGAVAAGVWDQLRRVLLALFGFGLL